MRRTEQTQNVGRVPLLQLLFVTYYPFGYKPCVEIVMDQRGTVCIRKTKRKFEKILKFVPIVCLFLGWFLCGFALVLVVKESKTYFDVVMNPVVGTWGIGVVLLQMGMIVYKVWIFDGIDVSVKMANEMLTIERELRADFEELAAQRPRGWKYSPIRFQFLDWFTIILYFCSPILLIGVVSVGAEPFLFLVTHTANFYPFLEHIWLPGYAKMFQIIIFFFIIWPVYNFIFYELVRMMLFLFSLLVNVGAKTFSILHSLKKKQICKSGLFLHKAYYSRVRIISQSVEPALKITLFVILTSFGLVTCATTFIVVRLHRKFRIGMTLFDGYISVNFLFLLGEVLTKFGRCDDVCKKFLRGCKNSEVLSKISRKERRAYLKEVASMQRLVLEVGVGQFTLARIKKGSKAKIMFYIFERIVNVLIAFR
ncbi:hypothetical protein Fcan01_17059 [Folsomia candida]|uniref:Uncharacterized protein n=1 Tax=Folsomia candida TaxID=158441 RepID=A0A226DQR4_FOLCA|nr:hypothetical protein Fcan01_17059 [Folsomia candida]